MRPRLLFGTAILSTASLLCACSGGAEDEGGSGSGDGVGNGSDGADGDSGGPVVQDGSDSVDDLPKPDLGPTGPTSTVGDGTAASCTEASLRGAIDAAPDRGVIAFDCGAEPLVIGITSPLYVHDKTLTIDGGGRITLDGGGRTRLFVVSQHWWYEPSSPALVLSLANITLQHAHGGPLLSDMVQPPFGNHAIDQNGGAILLSYHRGLLLEKVVFRENTALGDGGDVAADASATIYAEDVTFEGGFQTADQINGQPMNAVDGGSVALGGGSNLTLKSSKFSGYRVTANGAALNLGWKDSRLRVDGSTFARNESTGVGEHDASALFLHSMPFAKITNSVLEENVAAAATGALKILLSNATLHHVKFIKNSSKGYGAAIMVDGTYRDNADIDPQVTDAAQTEGTIALDDVTFEQNVTTGVTRAAGMYTCMYRDDDTLRIENSLFTKNHSGGKSDGAAGGAGLFVDCVSELKTTHVIKATRFKDNTTQAVDNPDQAAFWFSGQDDSQFEDVTIESGGKTIKSW